MPPQGQAIAGAGTHSVHILSLLSAVPPCTGFTQGTGGSGLAELKQGGEMKISTVIFPAPFLCQLRKPLIERKRRERINNCLDQLKETVVGAFHLDVSAHFMLLFVLLLVENWAGGSGGRKGNASSLEKLGMVQTLLCL